jgi:hypothetical protein
MIFRKTIALSFAAMLVSASAAMAATTQRQGAVRHRASTATEAQASYAAQVRSPTQVGPYYYGQGSSGSVWSYYPGYVPMTHQ